MATLTVRLALVQLALIFACANAILAGELTPAQVEGRAILKNKCGRCHAIDVDGSSPLAKAPLFRNLYKKFSVKELRMRLSEGVVSHYRGMPQIDFTSEEIDRIIDYLDVLTAGAPR